MSASADLPSVALIVDGRQRRARFGRYAGEILRAEGLGEVHEIELAGVTAAGLAGLARFGVVVLAGCGAVPGLPELLAAYVEAGGRLLLIRPPAELAPLAGLRPLSRALPDAALLVEPGGAESRRAPLGGFPYEPLQVAGALDLYHPDPGTTVLARAVAGRWPVGSHPAIVERLSPAGAAGPAGSVVAFLYDLPHTVARLRQGDPALAGYDTDGLSGVRPNDAQQWQIDPAAGHLPQAEVHQALLARAVEWLCPWPLPRLWYLPGEAQALLVLTGDLCRDRPDAWLVDEAALAERHGGTITFYLHERASLDPQTAAGLRQRGHSLSIHPFAEPFSAPTMDETLGRHLAAFEARFGGRPRTVRHHRLQWLGWAEQAALEHRHGLAMDLNFTTARPLRNGFHFGAGRPLPFVAETGEVLPVWQQPTHFEDDLLLGGHEISLGIDTREACALYDDLLDGARRRWHTVLAVNVHPGNYAGYSGDWGRHLVAQTAARGVPIWDAERWLRFTRARAAVCPHRPLPLPGGGATGAGPGWRIDVPQGTDEAGLMLLLPLRFAGQELRIPADGPVLDLFGWRYRGVALRGAPAAFDALYVPEGRAEGRPVGR
jgi:hypothetical protein